MKKTILLSAILATTISAKEVKINFNFQECVKPNQYLKKDYPHGINVEISYADVSKKLFLNKCKGSITIKPKENTSIDISYGFEEDYFQNNEYEISIINKGKIAKLLSYLGVSSYKDEININSYLKTRSFNTSAYNTPNVKSSLKPIVENCAVFHCEDVKGGYSWLTINKRAKVAKYNPLDWFINAKVGERVYINYEKNNKTYQGYFRYLIDEPILNIRP